MLALVKKPRTEVSLQGEHAEEVLDWLREKYEVTVLSDAEEEELVPVRETAYWREMERNLPGNLLAGARHRAGLTQTELARKVGIHQTMVSDYERGRRKPSAAMLTRLCETLGVDPAYFTSG